MFLPEPTHYELCPAGTHFARCWQIIDLGTQKTTYQGVVSMKRLVQIGWEIPSELMADGRPFSVFRSYTWSMSDKANFRKDLESWRGKKFTEEDFSPNSPRRFNIKNLLGVGATLTVIHKDSQDGSKTYANISSVGGLPKGGDKVLPPQINKSVYLGLTKEFWDEETYAALPEWLRDKIAGAPEFAALKGGVELPKSNPRVHPDLDDEIPF
jgi:hypothetical protein